MDKADQMIDALCKLGANSELTNAVLSKQSKCVVGLIKGHTVRVILKGGKASTVWVYKNSKELGESLAKVIGIPRCEVRVFGQ